MISPKFEHLSLLEFNGLFVRLLEGLHFFEFGAIAQTRSQAPCCCVFLLEIGLVDARLVSVRFESVGLAVGVRLGSDLGPAVGYYVLQVFR